MVAKAVETCVRQVLLMVVCAAGLSGCASEGLWSKVGALPADFDRDKLKCSYEGGYEADARGMTKDDLQRICLRERGWQQVSVNTRPVKDPPLANLPPAAPDATCDKNAICDPQPMH